MESAGVGGTGGSRMKHEEDDATACRVPSSKEDEAAARIAGDRESERRRDELVSSAGPSRAGESDARATCAPLQTDARTDDWTWAEKNAAAQRSAAARTAAHDRPIEGDPTGNAIA